MFFKPLPFEHQEQITLKLKILYEIFNRQECHDKARPYSEITQACPELDQQFRALGLEVEHAFIFQTLPQAQNPELGIHSDLDSLRDPNLVLNWPLFNCDETWMNFYRVRDHAVSDLKLHPIYQKTYKLFSDADCELIDRFQLRMPYIIDVNVPHNVTAAEGYRSIMSFRFADNDAYKQLSRSLSQL